MSDEAKRIPPAEEQLSELFGSYKAEWLKERVFDFFTAPEYLPELTTARPCVLVGGRGTGKTTVLKGLSYEGQFALTGQDAAGISTWSYYGFYVRVNTNRVTAFSGPECDKAGWTRLFAHYSNLLLCGSVLRFINWYRVQTGADFDFDSATCGNLAVSLHLPSAGTIRELQQNLNSAQLKFESYINNVADGHHPPLSMQGAPLDALFEAISESRAFRGKNFFFLVDEYENLEDYQQQVVNTLIKHSGLLYTFKIGVRELGWRVRSTLNENEQLISPADYVKINIVERLSGDTFRQFALKVCNARLQRLQLPDQHVIRNIEEALPGLTEEEEAIMLGVREEVDTLKEKLRVADQPSI